MLKIKDWKKFNEKKTTIFSGIFAACLLSAVMAFTTFHNPAAAGGAGECK